MTQRNHILYKTKFIKNDSTTNLSLSSSGGVHLFSTVMLLDWIFYTSQVFMVRQSSQPNTMALSVKLPPSPQPSSYPTPPSPVDHHVEHYLIEPVQVAGGSGDYVNEDVKMKLESSTHAFDNILALVYHYYTVRYTV